MTKKEELQEKIARIEANLKIAQNPVVVEAAQKKLADLNAQLAELEAGEGKKANTKLDRKKYLNLAQKRQKKNWGSFFIHSEPMTETIANKMVKALKGKAKIAVLRNDSVDLEISPLTNPKTAHKAIFDLAKKENWHLRGGVNDMLDENVPKQPKLKKNAEGKIDHPKSDKKADAPTMSKEQVIEELENLRPELNLPFWDNTKVKQQYEDSLVNYFTSNFDLGKLPIERIVTDWLAKVNLTAKTKSKKIKEQIKGSVPSLAEIKEDLPDAVKENLTAKETHEVAQTVQGQVEKAVEEVEQKATSTLSDIQAKTEKVRGTKKASGTKGEIHIKTLAERKEAMPVKVSNEVANVFAKEVREKILTVKSYDAEKKAQKIKETVEKYKEDLAKLVATMEANIDAKANEMLETLLKSKPNE